MSTVSLDGLTSRDLIKLQSDVAAALAKQQEVEKTQTVERFRNELRTDLAAMAHKWETKLAEFSPAKAPAATNGNGHHKPVATKPHAARKQIVKPSGGLPAKYKVVDGGQEYTWSGRGKEPRWLSDRIAKGAKRDDFRVWA